MKVYMRHPTLPGRVISVAVQSVPHHERAGWRRSDADAPIPDVGNPAGDESATPADAERDIEGDDV